MEKLSKMLNNVEDSYYDFIVAVLTYVKKKTTRYDTVKAYLDNNPFATSSDILEFISSQDDFYEDADNSHSAFGGLHNYSNAERIPFEKAEFENEIVSSYISKTNDL